LCTLEGQSEQKKILLSGHPVLLRCEMHKVTLDWTFRQNEDKEMHTEFWWGGIIKRSLENPEIRNDVQGLSSLSSGRLVSATLKVRFLPQEKETERVKGECTVSKNYSFAIQYLICCLPVSPLHVASNFKFSGRSMNLIASSIYEHETA
jgi:hypothetical protein